MSPGNRNLGQSDRGVIEAAKEKSQGLAAAAGDAVKTVKDKARDGATAVAETAQTAWEGARDIAGNVGGEVAHRAETAYADLVIFARRNPISCMVGCLGVGVALGMLLRPSR
jgi:ElaB/YqjD/DUF883 family membrane-anchored ribosome-binding protein